MSKFSSWLLPRPSTTPILLNTSNRGTPLSRLLMVADDVPLTRLQRLFGQPDSGLSGKLMFLDRYVAAPGILLASLKANREPAGMT